MSRSLDGINYWPSKVEILAKWWRKNLLRTAESLCTAMSLAGSGKGWWQHEESDLSKRIRNSMEARNLRRIVVVSYPSRAEQRAVMRRRLDSAGVAGYSFFDGVDCRSEPPCAAYLDRLHDLDGLQTNASYQVADGWKTLEFCCANEYCDLENLIKMTHPFYQRSCQFLFFRRAQSRPQ